MRPALVATGCLAIAAGFGGFGVLYAKRGDLYALTEVRPASLSELYPVIDGVHIRDLRLDGSHLVVTLAGADGCNRWRLSVDGRPVSDVEVWLGSLRLPLSEGVHDYRLAPEECNASAVEMNLLFGRAADWGVQNVPIDQVQVNAATVPFAVATSSRAMVPDMDFYSAAEISRARALLDGAGYDARRPVLERVAFVQGFIHDRVSPRQGTPAERLNRLTPLAIFDEVVAGRAKVACRQYALLYSFFANAAGIPTRIVGTGGVLATVDMGSHAFAESFVRETGRWIYVDPTYGVAWVNGEDGQLLDAATVKAHVESGSAAALTAWIHGSDGYGPVRYDLAAEGIGAFFKRQTYLVYLGAHDGLYQMPASGPFAAARKLWRFVAEPKLLHGQVSLESRHWLRPVSLGLGVVGALLLMSGLLVGRRRRRR